MILATEGKPKEVYSKEGTKIEINGTIINCSNKVVITKKQRKDV